MAKANNNGRTKKSHNYKPYDTSNSFVKRFTAKVSEILPQPSSWVSKLFSPAPKLNVRERPESEEEDEEEEERQPPLKRFCFRPSEDSESSTSNNINRLSDLGHSGEISPIPNSRLDDDRAVPGPSGLHLRNIASSTPAIRQTTVESSPKPSPTLMKRTPVSNLKRNVDRTSSLNVSSSNILNSSQPSFDTYIFKNPLNQSGLRSRSSLNESCFYPGETTFGGSSARISMPVEQPKARVVNVTASPSLQRDTIGTSALRILKALEQFSTPVLDAKKIPVRTEVNNPRKRKPPQPYEELVFPTMPELLSLKRREIVNKPLPVIETQTPSTSGGIPLSLHASTKPVTESSKPTSSNNKETYSLRCESAKESFVGSIRGRQNDQLDLETERMPELNLPNVQLNLTSLPSFNLGPPQEIKSVTPKPRQKIVSVSSPKFKFSEPEVLEKISNEKIIPNFRVSTYEFSEPLTSLETKTPVSQNTIPSTEAGKEVNSLKMKEPTQNFKLKRKSIEASSKLEPKQNFELKIPSEMKTGSIMDVFQKNSKLENKPKQCEIKKMCCKCKSNYDENKGKCCCENSYRFVNKIEEKTHESKWKCKKCQVLNDVLLVKCQNCSLNKDTEITTTVPLKSFEGFKKPSDSWNCKECFVMNKNSSDACVACCTPKLPKPSISTPSSSSISSLETNKIDPVSKTTTPFIPLVNSIKKPKGSWGCDTCLVQNKADVTSCVACGTSKPGTDPVEKSKSAYSFGISSSTPEANNFQFGANANGRKSDFTDEKKNQFSFGITSDEKKNSGFKFGSENKSNSLSKSDALIPIVNSLKKSEGEWECETCLIKNKKEIITCVACNTTRPGSNADNSKPAFSFGINNSSSVNNFQFGSCLNSQKTEAAKSEFTFGNQIDEKKGTNSSPLFKFGSNETKSIHDVKSVFNFGKSEKPKENDQPKPVISNLFSFGSNAKDNKVDDIDLTDSKPPKKKVSFGKPLVIEKNVSNDNNSTVFGNLNSNDHTMSSNLAFKANSPFENNSLVTKEPANQNLSNAFNFGNTETSMKPIENAKCLNFNTPSSETNILTNNERPNTQSIFGSSITGFKPADNKPFSFLGNSQGNFTFNAPAPQQELFGSQQPSGLPPFGQQQTPTQSLFNQQTESKPFIFGNPAQPAFAFSAHPQQLNSGISGNAPSFGVFATPPTNPAPVFDPNVKPTYNFTGGSTPSFSAPTSSAQNNTTENPERKVRRAIRRSTMHR